MSKNDDIAAFIGSLINGTISFAQANGLNQAFVVQALLRAAGTFGQNIDRDEFFTAINEFIRATRSIYPEMTFDGDPFMGEYRKMLQARALEEKQFNTVH